MKTALSLALVLASSSVNEGSVSAGSVTSGSNTGGSVALRPSPGGGGGASALDSANLRYNADDLALSEGANVASWISTGSDSDATTALVQATVTKQPIFTGLDPVMGNAVYFDNYDPATPPPVGPPVGAVPSMRTATMASPVQYPLIACIVLKSDSDNFDTSIIGGSTSSPVNGHIWVAGKNNGWRVVNEAGPPYNSIKVTSIRYYQSIWKTMCVELHEAFSVTGVKSKLARNGQVIRAFDLNEKNNLPEQATFERIGFGEGALNGARNKMQATIADIAVWGDVINAGITLDAASQAMCDAHGITCASPAPSQPYPVYDFDMQDCLDTGNQSDHPSNPGCTIAQEAANDGCQMWFCGGLGTLADDGNAQSLSAQTGGGQGILANTTNNLLNGMPWVQTVNASNTNVQLKGSHPVGWFAGEPHSNCMVGYLDNLPGVGLDFYLYQSWASYSQPPLAADQQIEWFVRESNSNHIMLRWGTDNAPGPQIIDTGVVATAGKWFSLCAQFQGASSSWAYKLDGGTTQTGTFTTDTTSGLGYKFWLYAQVSGGNNAKGRIAKFTHWQTPIDTEEMADSLSTTYGF